MPATATLETFTADGRVVISFPEAAVPSRERDDFIAFLKAEWSARQSRWTAADADRLAEEVDTAWWSRNRARILGTVERGRGAVRHPRSAFTRK